jgi:phosphoribosylformylglycinamidine synthase
MSVVVVSFPGSNCDRDCVYAIRDVVRAPVVSAWHKDRSLPLTTRAVILPGGFSYGDYLRCGAMAAHSTIIAAVKRFAERGGLVLGICNGFQILCETKLLPGALLPNHHGQFRCELAELTVEAGGKGVLGGYAKGASIALPIAHGDGNYFADDETLDALEKEDRIAFRYVQKDAQGHGAQNGSRRAIAGIIGGPQRNIIGLMPHPERRAEARLGGTDGLALLTGLVQGALQ